MDCSDFEFDVVYYWIPKVGVDSTINWAWTLNQVSFCSKMHNYNSR